MSRAVLIFDDGASPDRTVLASTLRGEGFEVYSAGDGERGLALIQQTRPELVILDAFLPKLDGVTICSILRADPTFNGCRIILTTAFDTAILESAELSQLGLVQSFRAADMLVQKPFSPQQMKEHVQRVLQKENGMAQIFPTSTERILLADDDRLNLKLLQVTLEEAGFDVVTTASGGAAIQEFQRARPDLVMVDVIMPDMSGLEVLSAIRAKDPSLAIIIMTGRGNEEMAVEAMKLGASDYLVKPLNYQRVGSVLREHIERSRLKAAEERLSLQLRVSSFELLRRVTELESARQELDRARQALEQANRAKTEMISTVSHELRTPLTNIMGYIELALEEQGKTQQDYLEIALENCQRLSAIVNDLLDISRIESGRLTLQCRLVSLGELVQESARSLHPQFTEKGVHLDVEISENPLVIFADRERVIQILDNLIGNACRYTPRGGRVRVNAYEERGNARVDIIDTGIGIPSEDLERIFEKFYRSPNSRQEATQGTGLGLPIAKSLIELHEGRIAVESEVGSGSTFSVWIPLHRDKYLGTPNPELLDVPDTSQWKDNP